MPIPEHFIKMSVNMKVKEQNCIVCSKVFDADSITTVEDVLDLLRFLTDTIDTSAFQKAVICTTCLENIKEAVNFKMSLLVKQENCNLETVCDGNFFTCYVCKKDTKPSSTMSLFNSCYENVVGYMIPKMDIDNPDNHQICNGCYTSLLNFQNMKLFLSVYYLNKTNSDQLNNETVTYEDEFKIDIVNHYLPEDSKLHVNMTKGVKQELEVSEEHLQKTSEGLVWKMDCEAHLHNEHQEISLSLPCPVNSRADANDSDLTTNISSTEMDYKESGNLKNENIYENFNDNVEVKIFTCSDCEFQTKHKISLKRHSLIHKTANEIEMFKCQNCEFKTKYRLSLKRHLLIHKNSNEIELFKCLNCHFQTKQKVNLKRHYMLLHKSTNEVKMFKCHDCDYQTKRKMDLKSHVHIHKNTNEVEMFKCHSCEFQTKYRNSLKKHSIIHKKNNEIEMFKCQNCDYQTKRKYSLKQHNIIHKGINEVEMFKCQYCDLQTKRKADLKKHELIHKRINENKMSKSQNCEFRTNHKRA